MNESGHIRESPGSLHDKLLPFYWEESTPWSAIFRHTTTG